MPGKPVTDQQVGLYMTDRLQHSQRVAAARAGFSERTARRIKADPRLTSQRNPSRGGTVPDPLAAVWEPVLLPILERDPAVQAVTLMRHLQLMHPEAFPDDRVRGTLERRVRDWNRDFPSTATSPPPSAPTNQTEGQYHEVIWRFVPEAKERAAGFRFHPDQILVSQPDGSLIVRFHAAGWLEMAWHLYQWGDKVEVIAPHGLRDYVDPWRRSDLDGMP